MGFFLLLGGPEIGFKKCKKKVKKSVGARVVKCSVSTGGTLLGIVTGNNNSKKKNYTIDQCTNDIHIYLFTFIPCSY